MDISSSLITADDLPFISQIQPENWKDVTPHFEFYVATDFCFPLKYTTVDRLAGAGCFISHGEVGWLAHIIVHPDFRNKGLGGRITRDLLDVAAKQKCKSIILLASHFGEPVYTKCNFVKEENYLLFKGELQSFETDPNIVDYMETDLEQILSLDAKCTAEHRPHLLLPKISHAKVYRRNGKIEGFYIPDLGEGLIVSETEEGGMALLRHKLNTKNYVGFPEQNTAVEKFVRTLGYEQAFTVRRMYFGKALSERNPTMCYSRIGGSLG